jgi:hypothetical protein
MSFEYWQKLAYGINRGECILFLGPELPAESASGERCVPAQELAGRLMTILPSQERETLDPEAYKLARIAQRFLLQDDEIGLEMEVNHWYKDWQEHTSSLHSDLAKLPFRLIVTSSHDPLMETALRSEGKTPSVEYYNYRGVNKTLLQESTISAPLLYHLYGHISDMSSLVLTETQLLDFLSALISKTPPLPSDLNASLTNGKMFLFLGFGLHQWYLRILLYVLKVLRRGLPAFAFEIQPEKPNSPMEDAILFYGENYRTKVYFEDVFEFVRQLREHCERESTDKDHNVTLQAAVSEPLNTAGPRIFLCHASEDKERAEVIHERLRDNGFIPWLDKNNLRGGDLWDDLIEETIKEVDYVIVLNSWALVAKTKTVSYVNKEIKVARRAEDWRNSTFIIPVKIDDAPLIDSLTKYQAVDMATPDGMRNLVRSIRKAESI